MKKDTLEELKRSPNMKLPKLSSLNVNGKKVLLRADLDVSLDEKYRLNSLIPTVKYLSENEAKIILIGHKGRPKGEVKKELSLEPIGKLFEDVIRDKLGEEFLRNLDMQLMENLRFNKGEEENDEHFARHIAESGEVFVNDAFAASHRKHASIVLLPKLLPHAAGLRFSEEVENLEKVTNNPKKPVVAILGGVKEDKLKYLEEVRKIADTVLVGGRLPDLMDEDYSEKGVVVARLIPDKEDLTIHSIEQFEAEIEKAGTIFLIGPMGRFEEEGHLQGTKRVFEAVSKSSAFKLAGGGDTEAAIERLKLNSKFDWISVGGGASLEFLTKGTLPGIDALLN
jgi:phosphoglycerate kinase